MIVARVINPDGRAFNARLVRQGDRYGLNDCLTHEKPEPMVEFYDATYENDDRFDIGRGQFVSRYYVCTLDGGHGALNLDGGVAAWWVSQENVDDVLDAIAEVEKK